MRDERYGQFRTGNHTVWGIRNTSTRTIFSKGISVVGQIRNDAGLAWCQRFCRLVAGSSSPVLRRTSCSRRPVARPTAANPQRCFRALAHWGHELHGNDTHLPTPITAKTFRSAAACKRPPAREQWVDVERYLQPLPGLCMSAPHDSFQSWADKTAQPSVGLYSAMIVSTCIHSNYSRVFAWRRTRPTHPVSFKNRVIVSSQTLISHSQSHTPWAKRNLWRTSSH